MSQVKQNIRIRFSKRGDVRFISHHDLMRVFERALRRADLPVAMSEGHNPRPRLSFPMALSVGLAGCNEVTDVGLHRWTRPDEVQARLQAELFEGIEIASVEATQPRPNRQPKELAYLVPLLEGHTLSHAKLQELLAADTAVVQRTVKDRLKQVDVRAFLKAIRLDGDCLHMLLRCTGQGTARPEEIMELLGCLDDRDYVKSDIERTYVNLSSPR